MVTDEQHRFGVGQRAALSNKGDRPHLLVMSATPIPRTLALMIYGDLDVSVIDELPPGRQKIDTFAVTGGYRPRIYRFLAKEIAAGRQAYIICSMVEENGADDRKAVTEYARVLQEQVFPQLRVACVHGRMKGKEKDAVMTAFAGGEADILVSTTVVEVGVDVPNATVMVIEDADRFGLSQLHQLRGRIGRSARRAYAYMTYRQGKVLSEVASKRLTAIREYVEFGSGFKIAMRDLEIRGAGNLLGPEQSGYMMTVGYDMYLQLLEDAVLEEKGEKKKVSAECAADLTISANIPEKYVPSPEQRMDLYRRIAAIRTDADASDLLDELMDRYGEPPKSVYALLDVAMLRAAAAKAGVSDISQRGDKLRLTIADFDPEAVVSVCSGPKYRQRLILAAGDVPALTLTLRGKAPVLEEALDLVEDLRLAREGKPTQVS